MTNKVSLRRQAGFSLNELLVVLVCLAAVLATQIPTQAASRRTARQMQNSTQLRGIHQALVTFANSNKERFAGLDSRGQILADNDKNTGSSGPGDFVQSRFWILLNGEYFTPEYAISPSETARITEYDPGEAEVAAPVQWNKAVKQYSYAMLGIAGKPGQSPVAKGRGAEWAQTLNSQAVVLSDRNTGTDAARKVNSIHSGDPGRWQGSVLWNDNHVVLETGHRFETKYGAGGLIEAEFAGEGDNLFADNKDPDGKAGYDALMVTAESDLVHAGQ